MVKRRRRQRRKNVKKVGQFLGINILRTTEPIFWNEVVYTYGGHKICKFCTNQPRDMKG